VRPSTTDGCCPRAGASAIDVSDPRWIVYIIYERPKAGGFSPVGFITVFKFFNPLGRKAPYCKPGQHETRRICQALIFPPFQRQGASISMRARLWVPVYRLGGVCPATQQRGADGHLGAQATASASCSSSSPTPSPARRSTRSRWKTPCQPSRACVRVSDVWPPASRLTGYLSSSET
jgi:hypothetical protein